MPPDRQAAYQTLVTRRKTHHFPDGLLNPSQIEGGRYDADVLGPWSRWQGNLHADVVVVGQDWGDLPYFTKNFGVDDPNEPTCRNLSTLALEAGWDLGSPIAPKPQRLFFTNAVLGIRAAKGKSGPVSDAWIKDSLPFLMGILEIVRPKAILTLGTAAAKACRMALLSSGCHSQIPASASMRALHAMSPIRLPNMPLWFPLYHCSPLGLVNRSLALQGEDWKNLRRHLDLHL